MSIVIAVLGTVILLLALISDHRPHDKDSDPGDIL